jgi:Uma2 family endonuclease
MGLPQQRRATYADVLAAPEHLVAEVIDGELFLSPRPAKRHTLAASKLGAKLDLFGSGGGGAGGGWLILDESELHLGKEPAILVPDLAGWRAARMPRLDDDEAFFTLPPAWICEVVSPSTGRLDRIRKLPIYVAEGVLHAWIVDPLQRSLEVYRNQDGKWLIVSTHANQEKVRAEPFEAFELELGLLWDLPGGA